MQKIFEASNLCIQFARVSFLRACASCFSSNFALCLA